MKLYFKPTSLILAVFSVWITLVCASLLQFDSSENLIAHSFSVWGDWSAHFSFISGLRERGIHWLWGDNPLFSGTPFRYPFLSHLLTAGFAGLTGLGTIRATYILSLALILVLPAAVFRFYRKFGLTPWTALVSLLYFFLMGGAQWLSSSLSKSEPLTNQFSQASVVTQFILFEFFPQRAFSFGLLALTLLLTKIITPAKSGTKTRNPYRNAFRATGLALGFSLLAFLHLHTWIAAASLLFFSWLTPPRPLVSASRRIIFIVGCLTVLISASFLSFLLLREGAGSNLTWDVWMPGWAQNPKANLPGAQELNFFSFWFLNTGLFLPLVCIGAWVSFRQKALRSLLCSGGFLFLIALLFNIQPYFYDNLKLITYSFFLLAPFAGIGTADLHERLKKKLKAYPSIPPLSASIILCMLFAFQTASATQDLLAFQTGLQSTEFFSRSELSLAAQFKTLRDSPDSLVLINPRHNHWVPCLTGNPVVLGYEGWLWSWGINYTERDREVRAIFAGSPVALDLLKKLRVRYVVFQAGERMNDTPINQAFFAAHFPQIAKDPVWQIYSVQ